MSCIRLVFIFAFFIRISCEPRDVPKLVIVSFDGFRPDYINATLTPNLYKLSLNGVRAKHMKSVFVTKTYPNHLSLSTGFYEETHGIIANEMYDPLLNLTFGANETSPMWWDNGVSLPVWTNSRLPSNFLELTNDSVIQILNELQNDGLLRKSGAMMWPGSQSTYSNHLPRYLEKYNKTVQWRIKVDTVLQWMTDQNEPANFVAVYFEEPDSTAHIHGPFSSEVYAQISRIDDIIGYLTLKLKTHKQLQDVNIVILSDHGMTEIRSENIVELNNFIDPKLYKMFGTSPVWNILPNIGFEDFIYNVLKNQSTKNHFTVYRTKDIPLEYHYRNHRRIQSLLVVGDEGYEVVARTPKSWNISTKVWGNHGYNNSLPSMRPLFIAQGPAFKTNYVHTVEFDNVDLFPLMCYILQLFPLKHSNGTLDRVYPMLRPLSVQRFSYSAEKLFIAVIVITLGFVVTVCGGIILVVCLNKGKTDEEVIYLSSDTESKSGSIQSKREKKVSFKEAPIEETVLLLQDECEEL